MSFGDPLRVARVAAFCIAALVVAGAPNEAAAQLRDVSNGTSYLTGSLGIGTTAPPNTNLEIDNNQAPENSNATPLGGFSVKSTASTALVEGVDPTLPYEGWIQVRHGTLAGYTYPLSLQPMGGNVGIGNTAPTDKLSILHAVGNDTPAAGIVLSRYQNTTSDMRAAGLFNPKLPPVQSANH